MARGKSRLAYVCPCLYVRSQPDTGWLTSGFKTKKVAGVMIFSPSESENILVSINIWFITKFERGHPERGRFLRLGWVRSGDFCDFSTNKQPYRFFSQANDRIATKLAHDGPQVSLHPGCA